MEKEWRGFSLVYSPGGALVTAMVWHPENFLRHGAELERVHHPPRLAISKASEHTAELVAMPQVANKRHLSLTELGDAGAAIVGAARLSVRELLVERCALTPSGVRSLLPLAPQLEVLSLNRNEIGDEGAALLAAAPFAALRSLGLCECKLRDPGAIALAGSPHLHLRELDLRGGEPASAPWRNRFGAATGRALAASPWNHQLEILKLGQTWLSDEGAASLAEIRAPGPIDLDLCDCLLESDATVSALAAAPWKRLARIGLSDNRIPGEIIEDAYDYDGTVVGRGPVMRTTAELAQRSGFAARGVTVYY